MFIYNYIHLIGENKIQRIVAKKNPKTNYNMKLGKIR